MQDATSNENRGGYTTFLTTGSCAHAPGRHLRCPPTAAPLLLLAVHTVRLSALVCRLAHLHPLLHPLLQRMALCVICCQCTDCDSVFRTCAVCQEMPRYRGVGMPKAKKKTVEQPSEAVEEPPAPPPATDPPNPPSDGVVRAFASSRARDSPHERMSNESLVARDF